MSETKKSKRSADAVVPRLFVLELNARRIHSMNADSSDRKTIVTDCHLPDGIVVDEDVLRWNPRLIYADIAGFGDKGPDADLPGFDITSYWARSGLLSMTRDAGAPPTWPVAGSGRYYHG